jgi:bisphosphoglycerate-independent phosphoglycerate mutase
VETGSISVTDTAFLEQDLVDRLDTASLCNATLRDVRAALTERLRRLGGVYESFRAVKEGALGIRESLLYQLWSTYIPLAEWVAVRLNSRRRLYPEEAYVLGLTGPQGSGKTTISAILGRLLEAQGFRTVAISIDDIYLTYEERRALAAECPWYRFRGLPGTHDVDLGWKVIRSLRRSSEGTVVKVPVFDKSLNSGQGDRLPEDRWRRCRRKIDIVLFEGWCVGARPVGERGLQDPINSIESCAAYDDSAGTFRRRVDEELQRYGRLFDECDDLVVLHVPNTSNIYRWRGAQEAKLKAATGAGMDPETVRAFVDFFLPATERYVMPLGRDPAGGASLVLTIGDDRGIRQVRRYESGEPDTGAGRLLTLEREEAIKDSFQRPDREIRRDLGTALIVTDGVGVAPVDEKNPLFYCETPNLNALTSPVWSQVLAPLWRRCAVKPLWPGPGYPRVVATILGTNVHAASEQLGLRHGQPGDSSVGHSSLGLGRYVRRYVGIIWDAIETGMLAQNRAIRTPIEHVVKSRAAYTRPKLHLWGICSRGYVHSDLDILFEILTICARQGLRRNEVVLHVVTDGKDVPKATSNQYVSEVEAVLGQVGVGVIGTICGRDGWICNRDRRFSQERNGPAARCILEGTGVLPDSPNALAAIKQGQDSPTGRKYGEDLDRFLPPTHIAGVDSKVESGDAMLCFNLREDRSVLFAQDYLFPLVDAGHIRHFVYSTLIPLRTLSRPRPYHMAAFDGQESGERAPVALLRAGFALRAFAESEKGNEVTGTYLGESSEAIGSRLGELADLLQVDGEQFPSTPAHPKQEPQMKAERVSNLVTKGMERGAAVIANICNGDVIGHYGDKEATRRTMRVVDEQLGEIIDAAQAKGVVLLITSDHGCVETWGPMHSANLVPLQAVFPGELREMAEGLIIGAGAKTLGDVEPTRFMLLRVPQPPDMTGDSIFIPDTSRWSDERLAREVMADAARNNFALLRRCPDKARIRRVVKMLVASREKQVVRMFLLRLERRLEALHKAQCPFVDEFRQRLPGEVRASWGLPGLQDDPSWPGQGGGEGSEEAVRELVGRLGSAAMRVRTTTGKTHLLLHLGSLSDLSSGGARALGAEVAERTECQVWAEGGRPDRMKWEAELAEALRASHFIVPAPGTSPERSRTSWDEWAETVEGYRELCAERGLRLLIENWRSMEAAQAGRDTRRLRSILERGDVGLVLNVENAMGESRVNGKGPLGELGTILLDRVLRSHVLAVRTSGENSLAGRVARYFGEQTDDVVIVLERQVVGPMGFPEVAARVLA